ncbi:MAG: ABC transporter ATP-binding protein [Pseudomonadota bacterium]
MNDASSFATPAKATESTTPVLSVDGVHSGYGHLNVLRGVSLAVWPHQIVTLLGSNGAGKSSLLKTISGLLPARQGRIDFFGRDITRLRPGQIVEAGLQQVAEGRRLFRSQDVMTNIDLGLYGTQLGKAAQRDRLQAAFDLFPVLYERRRSLAGALSGGQQQMLAIAQALMRSPKLLMLDEPSLGLAPVIVDQVIDAILALRAQGCAILLVEQLVERALDVADAAYVMRNGRILGHGTAQEVRGSDLVRQAYMSV